MQKPGRTRLGPVKLLVQQISIECVDSFVIRFKHTLFGNQHHLDLLPAFQCVVSSISTVVKEYLLVLTNFFPLCCKLPSQVGPGAGLVPPTTGVVIGTVVLLGFVILSVPGQKWKRSVSINVLPFCSYLVVNFIPFMDAIESPRVERASSNSPTVSL